MVARQLWSPSRVKHALSCGRHLQGLEEKWEQGKPAMNAVRGRVVHEFLDAWEGSERTVTITDGLTAAWTDVLPDELSELVAGRLQASEAEAAVYSQVAEATGAKNVRATKAYKEAVTPVKEAIADLADLASEVGMSTLPFVTAYPGEWLDKAIAHTFDTATKGTALIAGLYPHPDILGREWRLEAHLGDTYRVHGYIDRVELASDDVVEVVDYKTSRFEDTELDHFCQAAVYSTVVAAHTDLEVGRVRLVYLRDGTSVAYEVDPSWPGRLLQLVEAADRVLEHRLFTPTFQGCGICPFVDVCRREFPMIETAQPSQEEAA